MSERIKIIRKALGLNQATFGAKLGVTNPAISKLENGERNITEQMILAICREFNVNENWLRNGEGEMFIPIPTEELDLLAQRYNLPPMAKRLVKTFIELNENEMYTVLNFMSKVVSENETSADESTDTTEDVEIDYFEAERNKVMELVNAQYAIDKAHNKKTKKEKLSS